tara:strand:- start:305 stop:3454 length:3150 start_codon:yes stop_codon:yes gene_type:complete
MTSITQTISSFTGGISQQPDALKVPGQVTEAKNVLPDVTTGGLLKRPGGQLVKSLSDGTNNSYTTGRWFHYYRDETEQYIGQIIRRNGHADDGKVRIWRCSDGVEMHVENLSSQNSALLSYLQHTTDEDLQTLTLNDFTYVTNRTKTTAMSSTVEPTRPPEAYIELKKVAYANQYSLNLFDNTLINTVTTATRVTVEGINIGYDPMLPNVGTKIFNINGIPAVHKIDFGSGELPDGWYRITDGTTTLSRQVDIGSAEHENVEKVAEAFRNHPDYHKLKFTIGTVSQKVDVKDEISYGTEFRLVYKEGGAQSVVASVIKSASDGGTAQTTHSATQVVAGVNGSANNKKNLYFRITTTGQSVPHPNDDTPTYYGRYQPTIDLLYGGEGWTAGQVIEVGFKGCSMQITIDEVSSSQVQANLGLIRPIPTSFDTKTTVTAESILGALRTDIAATSSFTDSNVQQIGNGIYITRGSGSFNLTTPVDELLNVFTDSVKDVTELPNQCKHGYVVKVANSEAEEDDYYVKFFGDNDRDGNGVWEECAKPGTNIEYDKATLPIQIVRQSSTTQDQSGNTHANGWFKISQIDWENALVGDTDEDGTNPRASFVGKTINKMMFWRNRLIMLSDENIIMSQAGDFYNFWAKTALTSTPTDVIDISCSSEFPAIIFDGIQTNSGLVLFTKNQQFLLATDSDVLSPLTAKVNTIASYNFNHTTNPISLGTTIAFLDNAGKYSRLWEMTQVSREGEPQVLDQSKVVSRLLNNNVTQISNSKENGVLFFSEKGTSTLFGYRYFSVAGERLQQAWFTWELQGLIQTHCVLDDALYVVVRNNSKDQMLRFDLKRETSTDLITSGTDEFRIHLDNSETVTIASNAYNSTTDKTTFSKPSGFEGSNQLAIIEDNGTNITRYAEVTVNGSNLEITGDWSNGTYILGYLFDMQVEFPRFYTKKTEGTTTTSDTRASLVLHRVKLNLGANGLYKTILKRIGKPDYEELHESPLADNYDANTAAFYTESSKTIPIYDRNINTTLILKSTHPSPATIHSMTWEGDWTDRYYKNV